MTDLRIALRPVRFEFSVLGVLGFITVALAAAVTLRLGALDVPRLCFDPAQICPAPAALADYQRFAGTFIPLATIVIGLAPAAAALVVGVSLVGKELDNRTTVLAWSLSTSRRRWLALRVAPVAVVVLAVGLVGGAFSDRLIALSNPMIDPSSNLAGLGFRGWAPASQSLAVFGISLLIGAVSGRLMPSLLLSVVLAGGAYAGIAGANEFGLMGETIVVDASYEIGGAITREPLVRAPGGDIVTWDEALVRYGEEAPLLPQLLRINPGELVRPANLRLALLFSVVGLTSITLAFATVDRRRP